MYTTGSGRQEPQLPCRGDRSLCLSEQTSWELSCILPAQKVWGQGYVCFVPFYPLPLSSPSKSGYRGDPKQERRWNEEIDLKDHSKAIIMFRPGNDLRLSGWAGKGICKYEPVAESACKRNSSPTATSHPYTNFLSLCIWPGAGVGRAGEGGSPDHSTSTGWENANS